MPSGTTTTAWTCELLPIFARERPPWSDPVTTIAYEVPAGGAHVTLQVFDVGGRLVTTLVDGAEPEGERSVTWRGVDDRGRELPSGVYFYRMTAGEYAETRKMLLLK